MYEAYFGFRVRPFAAAPTTSLYYRSRLMDEAFRTLIRLVERDEGVGMVVGATGTGKTLLCHLLAEHFQGHLAVVLLPSGRLTSRRALLQHILFGLKLPYRQMDEGELRLSLLDFLEARRESPPAVLLVIDEAHSLPIRVLEELRLLSNLVRSGQTRVRLVLAGHPVLEERLVVPRLEPLNQRIGARCYLGNLTGQETAEFIRHQISKCGGEPDRIFTTGAYAAVARYSDGIPRLINQLCDHALILAYVDEHLPIDEALVDEAWCDLQRLPMRPTSTTGADGRPSDGKDSVVEFGVLDDSTGETNFDRTPPAGGKSLSSAGPGKATFDHPSPVAATVSSSAPVAVEASDASTDQGRHVAFSAQVDRRDGSEETGQARQPMAPTAPAPATVVDPFDGHFADEEVVVDRFAESPLPTVSVQRVTASSDTDRYPDAAPGVEPVVIPSPLRGDSLADERQGPARSAAGVAQLPETDLALEGHLLKETLAVLWSQPVIAAHCLSWDQVLGAPDVPIVQPVQHVRPANQ